MFPALSFNARIWAFVIAALALASILLRFIYDQSIGFVPPSQTLWSLARFFTLLTNSLVVVTFASAAFRRDGVNAPWVAALTLSIVLVGAVYHALLAGLVTFTGLGIWADQGLHTAVPIACLLWWIAFAPKRSLHFRDLPMFIVWPCVYVAYALARGAADGRYPYPFMDLNTLPAAEVAVNLFGLLLVCLLGGTLMIAVGRFTDR